MIGPGKYDEACTVARTTTHAEGALLIIINGLRGSGFSLQADLRTLMHVPKLLREVANRIDSDMQSINKAN